MHKPTDAELGILNVLWKLGPSTVRDVHAALGESTGYTTTLKLLQNMTEKNLVVRDEGQRAHIYQAAYSQTDTQQHLVKNLLHKAFSGSAAQLVMQALSTQRASPAELAEIRKLINNLSQKNK